MADMGSLSIVVDVSSLGTASSRVETFAKRIETLANSLLKLKTSIDTYASGLNAFGAVSKQLAADMPGLNTQVAALKKTFTGSSSPIYAAARALTAYADAGAKAGKVAPPTGLGAGGGRRRGGVGGAATDSFFDGVGLRSRGGIAVSAQGGINPFAASMVSLPPQVTAVMAAVGATIGVVVGLTEGLISLGTAAVETGLKFQRIQSMLVVAAGGRAGAAVEMEYVSKTAMALGLDLEKAAEGYGKFKVAANLAGMKNSDVRMTFESVAKASTAMGLSTSDSSRVFLALEQMLSKGKITAEELRKQLGNALPGAMGLMASAAKSAGVSTSGTVAELEKLMKAGKLVSRDILPYFAMEVNKAFGAGFEANSNNLQSNINRMNTAWSLFLKKISEFGLMDAANAAVKGITEAVVSFTRSLADMIKTAEGIAIKESLIELGETVGRMAKQVQEFMSSASKDKEGLVVIAEGIRSIGKAAEEALGPLLATANAIVMMVAPQGSDVWMKAAKNLSKTIGDWALGAGKGPVGPETTNQFLKDKEEQDKKNHAEWLKAREEQLAAKSASKGATDAEKIAMDKLNSTVTYSNTAWNKLVETSESFTKDRNDIANTVGLIGEMDIGLGGIGYKIPGIVSNRNWSSNWGLQDSIADMKVLNLELDGILATQQAMQEDPLLIAKPKFKSGSIDYSMGMDQMDRFLGKTKGRGEGWGITEAENVLLNQYNAGLLTSMEYTSRYMEVNQRFGTDLGKMWGDMEQTLTSYGRQMSDLAVDWAMGWIEGTETGEEAFRKMTASMLKELAKMIFYYQVLLPMVKGMGGQGGDQGGGGSGLLTGLMGALSTGVTASGNQMGTYTPPSVTGTGSRAPSGSSPIGISVNVNSSGVTTSASGGGDAASTRQAQDVGKRIGEAVRGIIADEMRQGGIIRQGVSRR